MSPPTAADRHGAKPPAVSRATLRIVVEPFCGTASPIPAARCHVRETGRPEPDGGLSVAAPRQPTRVLPEISGHWTGSSGHRRSGRRRSPFVAQKALWSPSRGVLPAFESTSPIRRHLALALVRRLPTVMTHAREGRPGVQRELGHVVLTESMQHTGITTRTASIDGLAHCV